MTYTKIQLLAQLAKHPAGLQRYKISMGPLSKMPPEERLALIVGAVADGLVERRVIRRVGYPGPNTTLYILTDAGRRALKLAQDSQGRVIVG